MFIQQKIAFIVQSPQLEALAQPRSHVMSGHPLLKLH
jgi:hypothetical protein